MTHAWFTNIEDSKDSGSLVANHAEFVDQRERMKMAKDN